MRFLPNAFKESKVVIKYYRMPYLLVLTYVLFIACSWRSGPFSRAIMQKRYSVVSLSYLL